MGQYLVIISMLTGLTLSGQPIVPYPNQDTYFLHKGAVIGIHFINPKPGVDKSESDTFLRQQYFPAWRDLIPGSRVYYLKGEKGIDQNKNTFFWVFNDLATYSKYWPQRDNSSEEYKTLRHKIDWLYKDNTFNKYFLGYEDSLSADFLVIESGEPVKKDWLQPGAVMGFHYMILKPKVDPYEFEQFIHNIWAPNRSDAVPGSKVFFLKGIRGSHKNEYVFLWILNSKETLSRYYPKTDKATPEYQKLQDQWKWLYSDEYRGKYFKGWDIAQTSDFIVIQ